MSLLIYTNIRKDEIVTVYVEKIAKSAKFAMLQC